MIAETQAFRLEEADIQQIQAAFSSRELTATALVQAYIDRIEAFDRHGPAINSIIALSDRALEDAASLDARFQEVGLVGPLHGIPIVLKDQIDALPMPTTLGSVLFRDYFPARDAFVTQRLREAGAIILGKATLGELGMGDAHGSLFGSTRNPYDLERTVGGSSGGPAAAVAANLCAVAIGQEALASIRRPAAWNAIVGMRPTAGLVSRSGVYAGWPGIAASLGPMTRGVRDQALLLDVIAGYDPEDPLTAAGVGHRPDGGYAAALRRDGLTGARIGILRESIGAGSEPDSEDFRQVDAAFGTVVDELHAAGAHIVDPVVIPRIHELLQKRGGGGGNPDEAFNLYFERGRNPPFRSRLEMTESPDYSNVHRGPVLQTGSSPLSPWEALQAREDLMISFLKTMADHRLDAIVHKSAEHQPTLIRDGVGPPFVNIKGATHLNTFLVYVPAISVPAPFTAQGLPVGITLTGRPYSDATMLKFAYAYEQATRHRRSPASTPPLPAP